MHLFSDTHLSYNVLQEYSQIGSNSLNTVSASARKGGTGQRPDERLCGPWSHAVRP